MQLIGTNSWTGTNGAGIDTIRKTFVLKTKLEGIASLFEYKKINGQNPKRQWVIEKLETLRESLQKEFWRNIDPIQYLWYLYFDEGFAIKDIRRKLETHWVAYADESSVRRLFENHFEWELRDRTGEGSRLAKTRRKVAYKKNEALREWVDIWRGLVEEAVRNKVESIVWQLDEITPITEIPEGTKIEKVAFILHSQWIINGPTIESLTELAVSLQGDLWSVRQVMSTIQEVVSILVPDGAIELDNSNFYKLLNKKEA